MQDVFWVIGACIMVMIAYLVRDWRHVLLIASFPAALFYLLWRLVLDTSNDYLLLIIMNHLTQRWVSFPAFFGLSSAEA